MHISDTDWHMHMFAQLFVPLEASASIIDASDCCGLGFFSCINSRSVFSYIRLKVGYKVKTELQNLESFFMEFETGNQ